jgi:hypothetical protein
MKHSSGGARRELSLLELQGKSEKAANLRMQTHLVISPDEFPARTDLTTARITVNSLLFNGLSGGKPPVYVWF